MSVALVPEELLRAALLPHRADPNAFEAGVRARLAQAEADRESAVELSPMLRAVASLLPAGFLQPAALSGGAVKVAPASGAAKLVGYAAFPAISLFLLVGATVFSVFAIRKTRVEAKAGDGDDAAMYASALGWWREHLIGAVLVYAGSLAIGMYGATWLLFLFYIVSFGLLLYVLRSLASRGLASRWSISHYCVTGLGLLGMLAGSPGIGDGDIHLLDQNLISLTFFWGVVVLLVITALLSKTPQHLILLVAVLPLLAILIPITATRTNQFYRPATPARIKAYVESFDYAPYSSPRWKQWSIPASWTLEAKLNPDLALPRRLLTTEIRGKQNPFILGDAFRVGLVTRAKMPKLSDYPKKLERLLDQRYSNEKRPILSVEQSEWVIRAAVMQDDLSAEQKKFLANRLHVTLTNEFNSKYVQLEVVLRVTQLLEAIGRPVAPAEYREQVHELLRRFHTTESGGFQLAGGFKTYENGRVGDLEATAYAVELMGVYGIPDGLDMDWVRSYLRPLSGRRSPQKWIAAVSLDRLKQLPGVSQPTWLEAIYYERSLLAAIVLVGLCIYATLAFPPGGMLVDTPAVEAKS